MSTIEDNATKVKIICPYCGHEQWQPFILVRPFRVRSKEPHFVTCDQDDGGCDKDYLVAIRTEITAVSHPLSKVLQ